MNAKKLVRLVSIFAVVPLLRAGNPRSMELGNPIAIDRVSDSQIFVLAADRSIRSFVISEGHFAQHSRFEVNGSPIDFTFSRMGQVESLFVCASLMNKGIVTRYSTDGKLMKQWWLWHPCGGLDYDPHEQVLYVGTTDTREIYRIDVNNGGLPAPIGQLPQMERIGPVALDSAGKQLYVGDIAGGSVFEFDIAKRTTRTLVSGRGSVSALYSDPKSLKLYIVDAVARAVLMVDPTQESSAGQKPYSRQTAPQHAKRSRAAGVMAPQTALKSAEFRSPSGVIPLASGSFVVSDYQANALFLVSSNGTIISRYP